MIKVIDKVLDIIELLASDPDKVWPLSSIADPLAMNHGTCANILKTLVARHYVQRMPAKKGYQLGVKAYQLSGKREYKSELVKIAKTPMMRLTGLLNENTLLAVLEGNQRVALVRSNCRQAVQVITPPEKNAYDSSTGRLLIAMQEKEEVEQFIHRYGLPLSRSSNRAIAKSVFLKELEQIRKQGYSSWLPDDQILGIALPLYKDKKVIASISVYAPAYRCDTKKRKKILEELTKTATQINESLAIL